MTEQRSIGLVIHHHREEVRDLALRALAWCEANGRVGVLPSVDAGLIGRPDLGVGDEAFGPGLDLCLSLGGDGTMLRAARLTVDDRVPLLGINAGHLGYLAEVDPHELEPVLDQWLAGGLTPEHRMLLEISFERADGATPPEPTFALNEVVLERAESGHTVSVNAWIAGRHFTRYLADGLIISTPTGSTAYSLSAGGPIVEPNFEALVVTPVAAHMVFDRSLVLAPSTEVRFVIDGYRDGIVTVDGQQIARLTPGDAVLCRGGRRRATFLVRGDRDFHTILKEKFGLTDR
ncbi:MAG: NAD(+)/NADH kinase [Acidimicrobiales bacterium]